VAEGSDWNWWYGDDHSSENDEAFDLLYRTHLKNIYQLIGKEAPKYLDKPVKRIRAFRPTREPAFLIQPEMDGRITNYYEWLSAGYFDIERAKGAMHQIETVLKAFYYGFSKTNLYLRLDCGFDFKEEECRRFSFALMTYFPFEFKLELKYDSNRAGYGLTLSKMGEKENWEEVKKLDSFGLDKIIELAVPFADIGANPGDEVQFFITVLKDDNELERWPRGGVISLKAPTESYESEQWSI
jgi:hypothetical protein